MPAPFFSNYKNITNHLILLRFVIFTVLLNTDFVYTQTKTPV